MLSIKKKNSFKKDTLTKLLIVYFLTKKDNTLLLLITLQKKGSIFKPFLHPKHHLLEIFLLDFIYQTPK